MKLSEIDYVLPESLIAQEPLAERDASRLLVLDRSSGELQHRVVRDLPDLLSPGDLMVVNDARVIPARLIGRKTESGGRVELLVIEQASADGQVWRCLGQASKALRPGMRLAFGPAAGSGGPELHAVVTRPMGEGEFEVQFETSDLLADLARLGQVPLPPYIGRDPTTADTDRYQTVFARVPGAVAAPTAGLHFTPRLLDALSRRGIARAPVTLLVGPGTFLPVRSEDLDAHAMRPERGEIPAETAKAIVETHQRRGRVVAVGTTVVRALEGAAREGSVQPGPFETNLFIRPGYRFQAIDVLFTNFHLPRSTLLALVCAFAGREKVLGAYREAVARRYRFYSYGDAMLIR